MGELSAGRAPPEEVEASSFEALFSRERAPMLRLAVLLVGSAATAEDVVQDAFATVSERWDALDRPGGYLRTTVVNGCRMVLRRREVEDRHQAALSEPEAAQLPTHLVELRGALEQLSERQRIVIVMRYFGDASGAEIAETLGCRLSTVRSLTRRGLSAMRKELA
jgi:RNA polymerase sigma factor (sigma-70 family)